MKRMRKSKPTMAMYVSAALPREHPIERRMMSTKMVDGRKVIDRKSFCDICNEDVPITFPLSPLMPVGACPNVPSPCGHCWYCEQRKQAVAK